MSNRKLIAGLPTALSLACVPAMAAHAQDAPAGNPIAERTGPDARQAVPDFAREADFARPVKLAPPLIAVKGETRFSAVSVAGFGFTPATIRTRWEPRGETTNGLTLDYSGAVHFDAQWVERQFAHNGLVGETVALDRIVTLVQLINRAFVANGYINTGVLIDGAPPEDGGTLNLQLIGGRLVGGDGAADGVVLNWGPAGRNRLSESFVLARMPATRLQPLNAIQLEREFRLLAENPAIRTISADLQPGARSGEARLALTVDPEPNLDIYALAGNTRSPSIGGERYAIGGSFRNFFIPGDIVSAESGFTGGRQDFIAGYEGPLFGARTLLRARGGFNKAAVIDPQLRPLDIKASDWQFEGGIARLISVRPLSPGDNGEWIAARSLTLGVSLAHRESKTSLLGRPFSFSPGAVNGRSEYTALRLTGDFIQRGIGTVLAVSLTATQGIEGTKGDVPGLISPDEDFRALRGQVSYARRLNDRGLELRARLAGQYADGILYSGERFAAGGSQTVRGYRETLVLADTGLNGSIELAQPFSLSGDAGANKSFDWGQFSLAAFVDGAILGNRAGPAATPGQVASLGATVVWTPSSAIRAEVTYGKSLLDAPLTGGRDLQDHGISFQIRIRPLELFR